jgi:hypothetical protein
VKWNGLRGVQKKGFIKKTVVSKELVKSLLEMSNTKEITVNMAVINEITVSSYVTLAHDSLREVLEALCIMHEYKVTSHFCIGELLKILMNDFNFNEFDRMRYIRNGINYYGEKIELAQGKEVISKIFKMKKELREKLKAHWHI